MNTVESRLRTSGLEPVRVREIVRLALDEDLGPGRVDVTGQSIFPEDRRGAAALVARRSGVIAGLDVAAAVFEAFETDREPIEFEPRAADGESVAAGAVLAEIAGPVRSLLAAERTALNLLSRMSGVATATRRWTEALEGCPAVVLDTRKTMPGLRILDKYAVRAGGGENKRMGLYDVAMIKDNHKEAAGSITAAFAAVRAAQPDVEIQVEVDALDEAVEAVEAGADFLLCDNMTPQQVRLVVDAVGGKARIEATGSITVDRAREYGDAGADYISAGALTHSAPILDIALDYRS